MALSAYEQYLLELINRGRLDPQAEASRYGVALNDGLSGGTISSGATQVLAPNSKLDAAADGHSRWVLATDTFSHTGSKGTNAGDRIRAEDYTFTGAWGWGENLSLNYSSGKSAIEAHYRNLYNSADHREHTFDGAYREIGLSEIRGSYKGNTGSMLTENFGYSGSKVFVTGVIYRDSDNNDFYGIGEGLGGLRVVAGGSGATTSDAGGYKVAVNKGSAVDVQLTQGDTTWATLTMNLSSGNGKLDLLRQTNSTWELALSASATLKTGISEARLLGTKDLNLTGHDGNNRLSGNKGDNTLSGLDGNDSIWGGKGHDLLKGGNGNDRLYAGDGNDRLEGGGSSDLLSGGTGADKFVFRNISDSSSASRDRITDFSRGSDKIDLSAMDANSQADGAQDFRFIGTQDFTAAGQLRYFRSGDDVMVEMDFNGDGTADMRILVDHQSSLSAGDFIF